MDKWLYGEPDVSKMWTIRKNLKNVKSKFRHRQADRKDLEEVRIDVILLGYGDLSPYS